MVTIKTFEELSPAEVYQILQARSEVFVVEQTCIYQDIDGKDTDGYHCFIKDDDEIIIAYLRLLSTGVSYKDGPSIGRVLVTAPYRKKGYATIIMKAVIDFAFHDLLEEKIIISAQEYLITFYLSLGFKQTGAVYLEDNIPHIKMILNKK